MLEQRERGEEPDFDGFMERHGDFFPGNPQTLDELLEQMAQSMAQMQQLMNSMTPEQRAQLQGLAESLLEDMDLRWQVDQLSRNLQQAFPNLPWQRSQRFSGDDPLQFGQMPGLLDTLGDLDDLEHLLRSGDPARRARRGRPRPRARAARRRRRAVTRSPARAHEDARGGGAHRAARGPARAHAACASARSASKALGDLYRKLLKDRAGRHDVENTGAGNEHAHDHKPYEFGDPFHLNVQETVKNAIWRGGAGTPVRLVPDDFEIERTEHITRSATVLMLDVSLSMPMRDNFLPAKKVAMALHSLITSAVPARLLRPGELRSRRTRGEARAAPGDELGLRVGHEHAARAAARAPACSAGRAGTKQIIMVTDGEPTAHIEHGEPYFQYPPSPITIEETLKEVMRCTRDGIRINTFMLDESYYLRSFVERMMRVNGGRAFFTNADSSATTCSSTSSTTSASVAAPAERRGTRELADLAHVELVDGGVEAHEAHHLDAGDRGTHGGDRDLRGLARPGSRRRRC